jgi:hypothetical protein
MSDSSSINNSSLRAFSPGKSPAPSRQETHIISAAVFRRSASRLPDTSRMSGTFSPMSSLSSVQPPELAPFLPQEQHQEDEFDYILAYYSAELRIEVPPKGQAYAEGSSEGSGRWDTKRANANEARAERV